MPDLPAYTILDLANLYRRGETSPVEVMQALLERIDQWNPRLNAYLTVDREGALRQAWQAEVRIAAGQALGPLDGIPIALKDLYFTAGVRTTAGSRVYADFVPDADATSVARLKAAGAVIVGKTNTHEFALGTTTENPHFGPSRNPWCTDRITGGSSGGSGAAVAAGLALGATGTDTGGSIRVPAALCGIVGFKPTYGRISRHGIFPLSWSLDHAGPMTATVADAALMAQAMAGPDPLDPTTVNLPWPAFNPDPKGDRPLEGRKIGVPRSFFFQYVDGAVEKAVRGAINRLEQLGADVKEVDWPGTDVAEDVIAVTSLLISTEGAAFHEAMLADRADEIGADVRHRLELGRHVLAVEYLKAQRIRSQLIRRLVLVFSEVDVIVTPTCPITAFPIGTVEVDVGGRRERGQGALIRFTRLANMTGWPALSVPCGFDDDGLPIGLQIMGRPFDELSVLEVGQAYEVASGGFRRPSV